MIRTQHRQQGFTLIELLVVIAIIGILSSVTLASMSTSRAKARDARRMSDLKQLQIAIELYADSYSGYPSTGGAWFSSEPGDQIDNNDGDYIPGLVAAGLIKSLPRDPSGQPSPVSGLCGGWKGAYLYYGTADSYKLVAHCSPEGTWNSSHVLYDPVRPTWAWSVCSGTTAWCDSM